MKNKGEKKSILRRPILWVLTVALGAAITAMATDAVHALKEYIASWIYPPKVEMQLTDCVICRTDREHFPNCKMGIVLRNPSSEYVSVELKSISIFRDTIVYRFPSGKEVFNIPAKGTISEFVKFRDPALDLALKIPQGPSSAFFKLVYNCVGRDTRDSVILNDSSVVKCTYWQSPEFSSESEAASICNLRIVVKWRGTETQIYLDSSGVRDFDGIMLAREPGRASVELRANLETVFRRKYGGVYSGILVTDTGRVRPSVSPSEIFGGAGEFSRFELLGMVVEHDFSGVQEFIYYCFDPTKDNKSFEIYHENSKIAIFLVSTVPQTTEPMIGVLRERGYRVSTIPDSPREIIHQCASLLTHCDTFEELGRSTGAGTPRFDTSLFKASLVMLSPKALDSSCQERILQDISRAAKLTDNEWQTIHQQCLVLEMDFFLSEFLTPVLVLVNPKTDE